MATIKGASNLVVDTRAAVNQSIQKYNTRATFSAIAGGLFACASAALCIATAIIAGIDGANGFSYANTIPTAIAAGTAFVLAAASIILWGYLKYYKANSLREDLAKIDEADLTQLIKLRSQHSGSLAEHIVARFQERLKLADKKELEAAKAHIEKLITTYSESPFNIYASIAKANLARIETLELYLAPIRLRLGVDLPALIELRSEYRSGPIAKELADRFQKRVAKAGTQELLAAKEIIVEQITAYLDASLRAPLSVAEANLVKIEALNSLLVPIRVRLEWRG